jgi:hypothetical protein
MKIRRAAIAATAAAVATAFMSVAPVGAQEPFLPISVTPSSGGAGTVVTVSGEDCDDDAGSTAEVFIFLFSSESDEPIDEFFTTVEEDGTWSYELVVEATDPPGVYDLTATCVLSSAETDPTFIEYDFASFEVTGTTPPTTPPTSTPEAPAPTVTPQAAPAVAVAAQPTFAG